MVGGDIGGGKDGGQLVLGRRHLVMLGLGQYAQLPKLLVQLLHKSGNAGADGTEVVILQLLPFGRFGAEQRAAGKDQILTLLEGRLIHQEILLLRPYRGVDPRADGVAEQPEDAQRLAVDSLHAAQQRRLFIQRLAAVRTEGLSLIHILGSVDVIDEQGHLDPGNFLLYRLQGMVGQGAINEAEDLLFDAIKAEPRREYLKVAIDFYSLLQGMEDDALKAADFTRQEIAEGLQDVRAIYGADGPDALV